MSKRLLPEVKLTGFAFLTCLALGLTAPASGADDSAPDASARPRPKRLLLIGQGPDGHPFNTHEYMTGVGLVAKLVQSQAGVQPVVVRADADWKEGPELIDAADGVFLFVSEGAKWLRSNQARLEAFQRLAKRGGGLSVIHWGMGTKDAENISDFVSLFGGCHGGPDRRYEVVTTKASFPNPEHPVVRGLKPFESEEEYYFALKFPDRNGGVVKSDEAVTPLVRVPISGAEHTVAWAWERPRGGRSFGFTGLHFHKNWEREEYRRLVAQGVLWTLGVPTPKEGIKADVAPDELVVPSRDVKK